MNDNVRFLRSKDITPDAVIYSVGKKLAVDGAKAVYVVLIDKEGKPDLWASGDLSHLCLASQSLNLLTMDYLNGDIEQV